MNCIFFLLAPKKTPIAQKQHPKKNMNGISHMVFRVLVNFRPFWNPFLFKYPCLFALFPLVLKKNGVLAAFLKKTRVFF